MSALPSTSITLLKGLAHGDRWAEFLTRYEGPIRAYLSQNFRTIEADDVVQEVLLALYKALPNYHYLPDTNGHFHNYLMGIVHNKAVDTIRRHVSETKKREGLGQEEDCHRTTPDNKAWMEALLHAAVDQLLEDDTISALHREIFRHVALLHESPDAVAQRFGLSRNNVDVIKSRLIGRLQKLVNAMQASA